MRLQGRLYAAYHMIGPQKGERILDIGCSTGYFSDALWRNNLVVGIDISRMFKKRNYRNVNFVLASATSLPFKENVFDKAAMLELIEHLNDVKLLSLKEIRRALKKNGFLILSTPNRGRFSMYIFLDPATYVFQKHKHFSVNEIKNLLHKAGFNDMKIYTGGLFAEQGAYLFTLVRKFLSFSLYYGFRRSLKSFAFKGLCTNNSGYELTMPKGNPLTEFLGFISKVATLEYERGRLSGTKNYYSIMCLARK